MTAHPLALTPVERDRLCASGLIRQSGEVHSFTQPKGARGRFVAQRGGILRALAEQYLGMSDPPHGTAKRLAQENDVRYTSLLTLIGELRKSRQNHAA